MTFTKGLSLMITLVTYHNFFCKFNTFNNSKSISHNHKRAEQINLLAFSQNGSQC